MRHKRALITALIILFCVMAVLNYSAFARHMDLVKAQRQYQEQIVAFFKSCPNSLNTVCAEIKAHPNKSYFSDGHAIETYGEGIEGALITKEDTTTNLWNSLANLMLDQNSSPLRFEMINNIKYENGILFDVYTPNQPSDVVVILFYTRDGARTPLPIPYPLYDDIIYWLDDNWYILYGFMRRA